jgi:hypothetical protein
MSDRVSFPCPKCNSKLRVSVRLVGRSGTCPSCGQSVVVPEFTPTDEGPVLVGDEPYTLPSEARGPRP